MSKIPYEASYRGKAYPSLSQLYLSIDSPEVSLAMFYLAVRAFRDKNPKRRLTDKIIESCLTLKRPPILYGRKSYLNLKEVWKAHPGPKPKYETVNMRRWRLFRAVPELVLTESVIEQLFSTPYDSELRRGLVYKLTNRETGLAYVGITGASIEERLKAHLDLSKHGDFSPDGLHEAIRCYGIKSFDLETLHQVEDKEELLALERKEIKRHRTLFPNGYNLDEGGRGWSPRGDLIEFRGRVFASFNQLCRAYDFDPRSVRSRLNCSPSAELGHSGVLS